MNKFVHQAMLEKSVTCIKRNCFFSRSWQLTVHERISVLLLHLVW